jgi:predicted MFS family arabinose efflux permease
MAGGVASFFAMPLAGRLVDRFGSFRVGTAGVLALSAALYAGFVEYSGIPLAVLFIAFMSAMALRNVAYNTLTSKVPRPEDRARFMSLQSAVQHAATSVGAVLSAQLLSDAGGKLEGVPRAAGLSIALTLVLPLLLWRVERLVRAKRPDSVPFPVV